MPPYKLLSIFTDTLTSRSYTLPNAGKCKNKWTNCMTQVLYERSCDNDVSRLDKYTAKKQSDNKARAAVACALVTRTHSICTDPRHQWPCIILWLMGGQMWSARSSASPVLNADWPQQQKQLQIKSSSGQRREFVAPRSHFRRRPQTGTGKISKSLGRWSLMWIFTKHANGHFQNIFFCNFLLK
jgi:hypothetical protein